MSCVDACIYLFHAGELLYVMIGPSRFLAEEWHFAFEPVLVHADLWQDHILLKMQEQQVSGIIEFGDVGIGDPALDVWPSLLPYYGGQVDETFR